MQDTGPTKESRQPSRACKCVHRGMLHVSCGERSMPGIQMNASVDLACSTCWSLLLIPDLLGLFKSCFDFDCATNMCHSAIAADLRSVRRASSALSKRCAVQGKLQKVCVYTAQRSVHHMTPCQYSVHSVVCPEQCCLIVCVQNRTASAQPFYR